MRNVEAAVNGPLHGAENTSTGGRAHESSVKVTSEGSRAVVEFLHVVLVSGYLNGTCVQGVQA